jgi:hypothetical protein
MQLQRRTNIPVWCITTMVRGSPMVWRTAKDRMRSKTLPPAFRTIVAPAKVQSHLHRLVRGPQRGAMGQLTQRGANSQNLVWVQARVGARDHDDALAFLFHCRRHLLQWGRSLIGFRELAVFASVSYHGSDVLDSKGARAGV